MPTSEQARELHERAIVIDGHNDTLILRQSRGESLDMTRRDERYHLDVPRAIEGGVTCSFFMVGDNDCQQAAVLIDGALRLAHEHPDQVIFATSAADIERAHREGKYAIVGQLEGCTFMGGEVAALRNMYRLGARVAGLTHGAGGPDTTQQEKSPFDFAEPAERDAARERPGLTDFGREVVQECNRLGMVVDLAHSSDAAFYDAVELSKDPVIFSHGTVYAECPHWRGLTDEQLQLLAENGGVMGMAFVPFFIDRENPTMGRLVDSIEHVVELVGPDHIGIGADFDGMSEELTPIPARVELLPTLTEALVQRGFDDETVLKVLGGNFLRVLREVVG